MRFSLEYHSVVKSRLWPSLPASLACWGTVLLPFALVCGSTAQINNASAISTHAVNAAAPIVAPPVRNIAVPEKSSVVVVPPKPHPPQSPNHNPNGNNGNSQHNTPTGIAYYPYFYPVPYDVGPGAADAGPTDASATDAAADSSNDNDPEYQGGPTIFDRRGSGAASYVPPVAAPTGSNAEQAQAAYAATTVSNFDPEPPQVPTILVFKDGHQLEVANYAIVSPTLYDLTPGHPRKIALSDIDLAATEKQNDDHGVVFQLPSSAQAN